MHVQAYPGYHEASHDGGCGGYNTPSTSSVSSNSCVAPWGLMNVRTAPCCTVTIRARHTQRGGITYPRHQHPTRTVPCNDTILEALDTTLLQSAHLMLLCSMPASSRRNSREIRNKRLAVVSYVSLLRTTVASGSRIVAQHARSCGDIK